MSYYDDASIMFIGGAATGTDGKAGTAKPIDGGSPLYVARGSNLTATRVDSNGLIEKGRENLLTYSNDFSNAAWDYTTNGVTRTASSIIDPDGGTNAWEITTTATNEHHRLGHTITSGQVKTFSFYAKANGYEYVRFWAFSGGNTGSNYFHLSGAGTAVANGQLGIASIESVGNGWYRCQGVLDPLNSSAVVISPAPDASKAAGTGAYLADGTSGIYLYNAQLEAGLVATEYIESGATTGLAGLLENEPRYNYPIGGSVPHLLLEPQRTNLIGQSEYIDNGSLITAITAINNDTQSPEGLVNATRFRLGVDESATRHRKLFVLSATSGQDYSFSVFFKEADAQWVQLLAQTTNGVFDIQSYVNFDLQNGVKGNIGTSVVDSGIEDYGNGWYRCYMVATAQATATGYLEILTTNNTDSGRYPSYENTTAINYCYVYGAQIEEASYPTSYIPNHSGGSVTREVDIYQGSNIDAVTNMSTDECTVLLDVDLPQGRESSPMFLQFIDIAGGGSTYFGLKGVYVPSPIIQLFGTGTINQSSTHSISVGRHKIAIRWLSGTATVYIDGAEVSALSTTDSAAPTSFDRLYGSGAGYRHFVHELIVFESGWDNVDLEILTGVTGYQSFAAMAATLNYTVYE